MPDLTKTALCRRQLELGACNEPYCQFAHNHKELRATDAYYKTSLCGFQSFGRCRLGQHCRHAHTLAELRPMPQESSVAPLRNRGSRKNNGAKDDLLGTEADFADIPQWQRACSEADFAELPQWQRAVTLPCPLSSSNEPGGESLKSSSHRRSTDRWADMELEDSELAGDAVDANADSRWCRMQTMPAELEYSKDSKNRNRTGEEVSTYASLRSLDLFSTCDSTMSRLTSVGSGADHAAMSRLTSVGSGADHTPLPRLSSTNCGFKQMQTQHVMMSPYPGGGEMAMQQNGVAGIVIKMPVLMQVPVFYALASNQQIQQGPQRDGNFVAPQAFCFVPHGRQ